ncbi:hypothetical protein [Methylobacter sp.]|uniref:hypothetical protein n=1 Tax=Methylobacter sp. TaxID=2051955 RepID=UPI002FDC7D5B
MLSAYATAHKLKIIKSFYGFFVIVNSLISMIKKRKLLILLFMCSTELLSSCAEFKEAGRTIGHTVRNVTREVGHGTRDAAKEIGHGTRRVVSGIGQETQDKAKELSNDEQ